VTAPASPQTFHGGKLPAQPARPHLKASTLLKEYRDSIPASLAAPPASTRFADDHITWDMYGNATIGDCTCAEAGHQVNQMTFYGSGSEFKPTETQVIAFYSAITGYTPSKPSSDTGAYIQDVLAYWRKNGLAGHKIVAYAAIDVANATEVKQGLCLFGSLNVGMNFPGSAMDQFNAGQTWDVVRGAKIEGGHCVMAVGYDAEGVWIVTWGALTKVTWAFWKKYVDEAWLILDADGVQKAGTYFTGLASFYALGQAFAGLTGETNPIPAPQPQPTPTPTPDPGPTPVPAPAVDPDLLIACQAMDRWAVKNGVAV
jgi:hypothetical protein